MSNFTFLRKKWPILENLGRLAERNLYIDSNTTFIKCGMFGEIVVQYMFSMEAVDNNLRPYDNNHNNRIRILKGKDLIPKDIDAIFHTLRLNRNNAAHGIYENVEEAKAQLKLTYKLAVWFMQTYGDWNFKPNDFKLPRKDGYVESINDIAMEYEEKYKALEEELNKLKAEEKDKGNLEKRKEQGKKASQNIDLSEEEARRIIDATIGLRYYQVDAIKAVENAIEEGKKSALINMATGTGKTRTVLGLIYRFLKTNKFKRVLYLVDKTSLRDQTLDSFKDVQIEDLKTLNQIYNINGVDEKLIDKETKIHITTVKAIYNQIIDSEDKTDIPHVQEYDCIIVDEAHRGYYYDKEFEHSEGYVKERMEFLNKYKAVVEYFNAFKIVLTSTPALHTTTIFGVPVYNYSYRQAVIDGYLVDHEPPHIIETELTKDEPHYNKINKVARYNRVTGELINGAELEDDIDFEIEEFNKKIMLEKHTRVALEKVSKNLNPVNDIGKTIIFAVNDSHADMIVRLLKEDFKDSLGIIDNDFILKITGNIKSREFIVKKFKNEKYPNIAVTVDFLSCGVDIPKVDKIVFLRRVKSRILYEQMLGRATRTYDRLNKTHFEIFDCVGICEAFRGVTNMKPVAPNKNTTFKMLKEALEKAEGNEEKGNIIKKIIAKLQRKKRLLGEKEILIFKSLCKGKTPQEFINILGEVTINEAVNKIIKSNSLIQYLDENHDDTYSKHGSKVGLDKENEIVVHHKKGYIEDKNPQDYINEFKGFIVENKKNFKALEILCRRPHKLKKETLKELKAILDSNGFSEEDLKKAWRDLNNEDSCADIIAFIRQVAIGTSLESNDERVKRAIEKIKKEYDLISPQEIWINRIEKVMMKEIVIDKETLDTGNFKVQGGGFNRLNEKVFEGNLGDIISKLKRYMFEEMVIR